MRRTPFPGPAQVGEAFRINFQSSAYAELIAHAKESLDREVCGVLIGAFGEDDDGRYVVVEAIIRGNEAVEGGAHVTYTQETWNHIHEVKDRDYPEFAIVGWYHTHPGFGVVFSDMDMFIQNHFFSAGGQLAYLTDPLGGEEAICVNTPGGLQHVRRYWVNGRERRCHAPVAERESGSAVAGRPPQSASELQALENRVTQLIQEIEGQRTFLQRVVVSLAMVASLFFVYFIVTNIVDHLTIRAEMPKLRQEVPVVVRIGDKNVLLGVGIYAWDVPRDLDSYHQKVAEATAREQARRSAEAERLRLEHDRSGTNARWDRRWYTGWRLLVGTGSFLALGAALVFVLRRRRSSGRGGEAGP